MKKIYLDSHVEIQGFSARHYDRMMDVMFFGSYKRFIKSAIKAMEIKPGENILDLGCGTGRNSRIMHNYCKDEGYILGIDISEEMQDQFVKKFKEYSNIEFKQSRIDVPLNLDRKFDTVFMSFVLHGLPHEARLKVVKNIFDNLKPGGRFCLLDFSEFKLDEIPKLHKKIFTTIECKYAFEFVERDWKEILSENGFTDFKEKFWIKKYVRLLTAYKNV